jgi:predicted RNase H-like HicB family nuclease
MSEHTFQFDKSVLTVGVDDMKYKVSLQKSDEGYSVSVPGLPGCWSQGKTEAEALENIRDAIREYIDASVDLMKDSEIREVEVAP